MQITSEQQHNLSRLLAKELEYLRRLVTILDEEHKILCSGKPNRLEAVCSEKVACLAEMERLTQGREQFQKKLGLPTEKPALDNLFRTLLASSPLAARWEELCTLSRRLQRQNEINGGILALLQRHAAQALMILTGRPAKSETYGPDGASHTGPSSNRLARA